MDFKFADIIEGCLLYHYCKYEMPRVFPNRFYAPLSDHNQSQQKS